MAWVDFKLAMKNMFKSPLWLPLIFVTIATAIFVVGIVELMPWHAISATLTTPDTLPKKVWVWITASLLSYLLANAIYYLASSLVPDKVPDAATVFAIFWSVAVAILLLLLIFSIGTDPGYGVLAAIAGAVVGWLIAMYLTPENPSEQQQFAKIGTAVVALFSGYGIKTVVDWIAQPEHAPYRIYCGLFVLSALVCTAAVYNTRAYGNKLVKITAPPAVTADPKDKKKFTATIPANLKFVASATGVKDTSVTWQLVKQPSANNTPPTFTDGNLVSSVPGDYTILARSNFDPTLVDAVDITLKPAS